MNQIILVSNMFALPECFNKTIEWANIILYCRTLIIHSDNASALFFYRLLLTINFRLTDNLKRYLGDSCNERDKNKLKDNA